MEFTYVTFRNGVIRIFHGGGYCVKETFDKVFFDKVTIYCDNPFGDYNDCWVVEDYRNNLKGWIETTITWTNDDINDI